MELGHLGGNFDRGYRITAGETHKVIPDITSASLSNVNLSKITWRMSPGNGTIRARFKLQVESSDYHEAWAQVRVYRNGQHIFTGDTFKVATYLTSAAVFSQDVNVQAGDSVEIWSYSNTNTKTYYVREFNLYYTPV